MNPSRNGVPALACKCGQRSGHGGTICKVLLLASTLAAGSLTARPAEANAVTITTTGTITSGSESGNVFGFGAGLVDLTGDSYTLSVTYNYLGPNYSTIGGVFAQDNESSPGVPGIVTATVNGVAISTSISSSLGSSLFEDLFDLDASNNGSDGPGNFVSVAQFLSCSSSCVPTADLQTPFAYTLQPFDSGTDIYNFQGAGFPAPGAPTASFFGTETSLTFQVPEPQSWALLVSALLGLGLLAQRRRA